jgi:hypothetical protein
VGPPPESPDDAASVEPLETPYRRGDPCWGSTDETVLLSVIERARAEGREHPLRYEALTCREILERHHPTADVPYARFSFESAPEQSAACQTTAYFPESVALIAPSGVARWCVPLPEVLRHRSVGRLAVENHLTSPHAMRPIRALVLRGNLLLHQAASLFVLAGDGGQVLLGHTGTAGSDRFTADSVRWEARAAGARCRGDDGTALLTVCGDRIIAFDGRTLLVAAPSPLRILAETRFDAKRHLVPPARGASTAEQRARIEAGDVELLLTGTLYM